MHPVKTSSRLSSSAIFVSIAIASLALPGQQPVSATPEGQQAPAATVPTPSSQTPVAVIHTPPPTPEQVGDTLMAKRRYQEAIESYKHADPTATVWNKLGIAYQMMFNLEDATRCYKTSLKLDPKNALVMNNLGTVYDSQKDYKRAEKMYRRALKIEPHSALVLKNLGTELLARHKYEKGWEEYKAALTLDPTIFTNTTRPQVENPASVRDRGAMNYYMAKGCVRAGFKEQAIEYLRQALNEGFTNPKAIIADREFATLRGNPAFERLLADQKSN
jgi:Tfp pilus assembly protein PilF